MKRFLPYLLILLAGIVVVGSSCKKQAPVKFYYEYFGLNQGKYVIYDVVEIIHDDALNQHDTLRYQLKTYWADTFVDNQGRITREFWRSTRDSSSHPWVFKDIWTGIIDGVRAELIEENQRVVKLVFAPTPQKEWNANAYNIWPEMECNYGDIHQEMSFGGTVFDSTLVVEQEETYSLIDTIRKYEVYANHIGLVYKHSRDLNFQFNQQGQIYLDKGRELFYTYSSSGVE